MGAPVAIIDYTPPPTVRAFIKDHKLGELFYDWIVGPVGSGKTTGLFFKLVVMAQLQEPSPDGIRRTRAVIVRNTMPQLKDTTLVSWGYWFKDGQAGDWNATDKIFTLRFADCECIVLFRPLDTPDDISRVLSLELNFAIIDEFVEIPRAIIDALSARLGRYKQPDGTAVSIWGMWGSSNPSTEDNWWFDYLHGSDCARYYRDKTQMNAANSIAIGDDWRDVNAKYFTQPSALTDARENVENLPGKMKYYSNVMKGKSDVWIKQFIEAEWGFSISGQAVVTGFREDIHVTRKPNYYNPYYPVIAAIDPGIGGSAVIFMQEDLDGRLNVFDELVQQGMGAERIIKERMFPLIRAKYSDVEIVVTIDPAAASRSANDERMIKQTFERYFRVECETNNRLPLRLNGIDYFIGRLVEGGPALRIAPHCKHLIRALKGGWRYAADVKKDILKGAEPEKNAFSHVGDAFGYGCRFYHKGIVRAERYGLPGRGVGTIPQSRFGPKAPARWGVPAWDMQTPAPRRTNQYNFR